MYVYMLMKVSVMVIEYITSGGKEVVEVVQLQSWDKMASLLSFVMEVLVLEYILVSSSGLVNRNLRQVRGFLKPTEIMNLVRPIYNK